MTKFLIYFQKEFDIIYPYLKKHIMIYLLDRIHPNKLLFNEEERKRAEIIYKEKTKLQAAFIEVFYRGNRS
jgi:hypothetical protein